MQRVVRIIAVLIVFAIIIIPPLSHSQSPSEYNVSINETGLPNGTAWQTYVNGAVLPASNNSTIVFEAANGTYSVRIPNVDGLEAVPNKFSITISGGNVSYNVVFGAPLYNVSFFESGLTTGTIWNVTIGNNAESSINSSITFHLKNGTYAYSVGRVTGAIIANHNGSITVNGRNVNVTLRFLVSVQFTFIETGLPSGAHWGIKINGTFYNSSSSFISMNLTNGSYNFVVDLPSGYSASPRNGVINWNNTVVLISASSPIGYEIGIAVLIVIVTALFILRTKIKRKQRKTAKEAKSEEKRK
ncbi:MAG: hypothetical protein M0Z77_07945 [Thermoplasmatales archaeon]|jgi:hypothetical protein|nr:hypothetical protein [Candidatus Thermoplasmatota archaeon]MCL6002316.1 hypothetical protein [Candidatus Thermoplasmatota archaeon]MDA8055559.1 hypothetical protein [Thermoplasmatales archaeon]